MANTAREADGHEHVVLDTRTHDVQLALGTQAAMFTLIVLIFTGLGKLAAMYHRRLVRFEEEESLENTKKGATATVLQPLPYLLPALGWLLAVQRATTGALLHLSLIHI